MRQIAVVVSLAGLVVCVGTPGLTAQAPAPATPRHLMMVLATQQPGIALDNADGIFFGAVR
jgi:hypothetical protein